MAKDFIYFLDRSLEQNRLSINNVQKELFHKYFLLSQKWGAVINITANITPEKFLLECKSSKIFSTVGLVAILKSRYSINIIMEARINKNPAPMRG